MKKQRNNHARSKQKRRKLRLKNFWKRVFEKRTEKKIKAIPSGRLPFQGDAKKFAPHYSDVFPQAGWNTGNNHGRFLNQRQKRKLNRQQPHGK